MRLHSVGLQHSEDDVITRGALPAAADFCLRREKVCISGSLLPDIDILE